MKIYVVQPGDSVDSIARSQAVSVENLIFDNQIEPPYRLAVGQALYIEERERQDVYRIPLYVFGYAYPFINRITLDETLPFLTDLYVFSYGFTAEGNLIPPKSPDDQVVETALSKGVRPILVLTPLGDDGRFNNNLISIAVHDLDVQQNLIWNLGRTMLEKGYGGVDLDFEYISSEDRVDYARFVSRVTQIMNLFGYQVSVALAPKTSAGQRGVLYEGMDYRLLGEAANRMMLMTYEWGYTYGPPQAVAPINQVKRVVEYAVSEIPRERISLGIPNYGYDWPLPFVSGQTKANTISNREAVQIAIDHGVAIEFDEIAMSPYFRYWQYGIQHEVWFEDVRSYQAKFELIKEYGLTGAGYWQLMNFFRPNWLLLEDLFLIEKV